MADGAKGLIGKLRERLGWLTADRKEEARGRLDQADAAGLTSRDGESPSSAAEAVDRAELVMRDEYGDLAPEAKPDEGRRSRP
jgi:uncharacterized protein YjbJ (UPF0337 family)